MPVYVASVASITITIVSSDGRDLQVTLANVRLRTQTRPDTDNISFITIMLLSGGDLTFPGPSA